MSFVECGSAGLRLRNRRARDLVLALLFGVGAATGAWPATPPAAYGDLVREGVALSQQGNLELAIEAFKRARVAAPSDEARAAVDGELGAALTRDGRYTEAQPVLKRAYLAGGPAKAARAIDLGNLALAIHDTGTANKFFAEARTLAGDDVFVDSIAALAHRYKSLPMIARTHGQEASPTTVGKEMAIFAARLERQAARSFRLQDSDGFRGNAPPSQAPISSRER